MNPTIHLGRIEGIRLGINGSSLGTDREGYSSIVARAVPTRDPDRAFSVAHSSA